MLRLFLIFSFFIYASQVKALVHPSASLLETMQLSPRTVQLNIRNPKPEHLPKQIKKIGKVELNEKNASSNFKNYAKARKK